MSIPKKRQTIPLPTLAKSNQQDRLVTDTREALPTPTMDAFENQPGLPSDVFKEFSQYGPIPAGATIDQLMATRAREQSTWDQLGNFVAQSVAEVAGGTIEGLGYLADFEEHAKLVSGAEQDFSNWFSDIGIALKEGSREKFPIYAENPGTFDPGNAGWWFSNGVSVFSTFSLMLPTVGAVKGLAALARMAKVGKNISASAQIATEGISGAVASRVMENTMESSQLFKEVYEAKLEEGASESEAKFSASQAAKNSWKANTVNLAFDIPQYMFIFGKGANLAGLRKTGTDALMDKRRVQVPLNMAQEGFEEFNQFVTAEEAKKAALEGTDFYGAGFGTRLKDYVTDGEAMTSTFFGAIGGGAFAALGPEVTKAGDKLFRKKATAKRVVERELVKQRLEDPESFLKMQDEEFVGLAAKHAKRGKLNELQEFMDLAEKATDEEITALGLDPNTFRDSVAKRKEDLQFIGELWNRMGNTLGDPRIKHEIFEATIRKRLVSQFKSKMESEISDLVGDSVSNEEATSEEAEKRLNEMRMTILESFEPSNEKEKTILEERKKEVQKKIDEAKGIKARPLTTEPMLAGRLQAHEASLFEAEVLDSYLKDINTTSGKKELLEKLKKEEEEQKKIKAEAERKKAEAEARKKANEEAKREAAEAEKELDKKLQDLAQRIESGDNITDPEDLELQKEHSEKLDGMVAAIKEKKKSTPESVLSDEEMGDLLDAWNGMLPSEQLKVMNDPENPINKAFEALVAEGRVKKVEGATVNIGGTPFTKISYEVVKKTPNKKKKKSSKVFKDSTKTSDTEHTSSKQKDIKDEAERTMHEASDFEDKTKGPKRNLSFEYFRSEDGYNLLAYLSRTFMQWLKPWGSGIQVKREDLNDRLNDNLLDPNILDPKQYPPGTKLTLKVLDDPSIPMYIPTTLIKEETTWGEVRDILETEADKVNYTPIGVYKDGELVAYLHTKDWLTPQNISGDIQMNRDKLYAFRKAILANGTVETKITERSSGVLIGSVDGWVQTSVALPGTILGISTRGTSLDNIPKKIAKKLRNKEFTAGVTYAIIPLNDGTYIATPLQHEKVQEKYARSIVAAVRNFIEGIDPFGAAVQKELGIDLSTVAGLQEYITMFVNDYKVPESFDNHGSYNSPLGAYAHQKKPTNFFGVSLMGNGISWAQGTIDKADYNISKNTPKENLGTKKLEKDKLYTKLYEHLQKMYFHVSASSLGKDLNIPLETGVDKIETESTTYEDLVKANTLSSLISFNIGTEENPNYIYQIQSQIQIDTSISEEKKTPVDIYPIDNRRRIAIYEDGPQPQYKRKGEWINYAPGSKAGADLLEKHFSKDPETVEGEFSKYRKGVKYRIQTIHERTGIPNILDRSLEEVFEVIKSLPQKTAVEVLGLLWEIHALDTKASHTLTQKEVDLLDDLFTSTEEQLGYEIQQSLVGKVFDARNHVNTVKWVNYAGESNNTPSEGVYIEIRRPGILKGGKLIALADVTVAINMDRDTLDKVLNKQSQQRYDYTPYGSKAVDELYEKIKQEPKEKVEFELDIEDETAPEEEEEVELEIEIPDPPPSRVADTYVLSPDLEAEGVTQEDVDEANYTLTIPFLEDMTPRDARDVRLRREKDEEFAKKVGIEDLEDADTYEEPPSDGPLEDGTNLWDHDFGEEDALPLSEAQVGLIEDSVKSLVLIPGITPSQQASMVRVLANMVIDQAFADQLSGTATDRDKVYAALKKQLEAIIAGTEKQYPKLTEAQRARADAGIKKINVFLDNWGLFATNEDSLVNKYLRKRSGVNEQTVREMSEEEENTATDKNDSWNEYSAFTIDGKDTASARVKRFLSAIPDRNPDGSLRRNFLRFKEYIPFDYAFNTLSAWLSGMYPDYESMREELSEYVDANPWVQSLLESLDNATERERTDFVVTMTKHYVQMKFVSWSEKNGRYTMQILRDDSAAVATLVRTNWLNKLSSGTSGLTVVRDNQYYVDPEAAKSIVDRIEKYKKKVPSKQELKQLLEDYGIELSDRLLDRIVASTRRNGITYGQDSDGAIRYSYADMFKKSGGLFYHMAEKLSNPAALKDTPVEDLSLHKIGMLNKIALMQAQDVLGMYTNSYTSGGESIYAYQNNKYIVNRMRDLVDPNSTLPARLANLPFNKHASWLQYLLTPTEDDSTDKWTAYNTFLNEVFEMSYVSLEPLNKARSSHSAGNLEEISEAEHEVAKLGYFTNMVTENKGVGKKRIAEYMFSTISDKGTGILIKSIVEDIELGPDNTIADAAVNLILDHVITSEIERILAHQDPKPGLHDIKGYEEGAKQFLFMPSLNKLDAIWTPDHKLKDDVLTNYRDEIFKEVKNHLEQQITKKREEWAEYGIGYRDNEFHFVDKRMLEYLKKKGYNYRGKLQEKDRTMKKLAADYVVNYMLANHNFSSLFWGDPALYYKQADGNRDKTNSDGSTNLADPEYDFIEDAKATFINVGKRLAAQNAPGYELDGAYNEKFKVAYLVDAKSRSNDETLEFYRRISKSDSPEDTAWIDEYMSFDGTDAQEYTTAEEHLYVMLKTAQISQETFNEATALLNAGKDLPLDILGKVLQPLKPVYVQSTIEGDVANMTYIKSSSFPLLPQLTRGLELDKLRIAMENPETGVDRVAFSTAVKLGNVNNPLNIWNEDGTITDDIQFTVENSKSLPRSGFRIQQDIPIKKKRKINVGTQERKLLFMDIAENYPEELKRYNSIYDDIWSKGLKGLYKEIEYDPETRTINLQKLQQILYKEAEERNYSINDLLGLELIAIGPTDQFKAPLWSLPGAKKIEALLMSIVDNRARKILFEGKSLVLGSEEGIRVQGAFTWARRDKNGYEVSSAGDKRFSALTATLKDGRTIEEAYQLDIKGFRVKGDNWRLGKGNAPLTDISREESWEQYKDLWRQFLAENPDLKEDLIKKAKGKVLTDKFASTEVSQARALAELLNEEESGNLLPSGIKFTSSFNGRSLQHTTLEDGTVKASQILIRWPFKEPMEKFLKKDGTIDEEMLPKDLLHVFGFRIPTQGPNSTARLEIVGFLPPESGDLVIASKDLVVQMGSDFDIDKLNIYMYETQLVGGKMYKKETPQNEILDIHLDLLSKPDNEIQRLVHAPLVAGALAEVADEIDASNQEEEDTFSPLTDMYQRQKYMSATQGKSGVGVFALDITLHATMQQSRVLSDGEIISITNPDGDFELKFGKEVSVGTMGNTMTLDGKYRISSIISEFLSAAVDNEKEQILGKINANNNTFNVYKVLNLLGFNPRTTAAFINQPIIVEYINTLRSLQSSLNEYQTDPQGEAYTRISNKYRINGDIAVEEDIDEDLEGLADLSGEEMLKMLEEKEKTANYHMKQLALLDRFLQLDVIGRNLASVQSTINIDSAGVGKSIMHAVGKYERLVGLMDHPFFKNMDTLVGKYDVVSKPYPKGEEPEGYIYLGSRMSVSPQGKPMRNHIYVKPTTINGMASVYNLSAVYKLYMDSAYGKLFPYNTDGFNQVVDEIERITFVTGDTLGQSVNRRERIFDEMKGYLVTSAFAVADNGNIENTRERLFIDSETNKSLATRLSELSTEKFYKNNAFLMGLNYVLNSNGDPSLIKYQASLSDGLDQDRTYGDLVNLITNPTKFKDGTTTRDLVEDLVKYAYLSGGAQKAVQFMKYIPYEYLNQLHFFADLRELDFNDGASFGAFGMGHRYTISGFATQYVQHNPRSVPNATDKVKVKDYKKLASFTPGEDLLVHEGEEKYFPPFVHIETEDNVYLFRYDGQEYIKVDTLGKFGMSEYNYNKRMGESLIPKNQTESTWAGPEITPKDTGKKITTKEKLKPKILAEDNLKRYNLDQQDPILVLDAIIQHSADPMKVELAKQLKTAMENEAFTTKISVSKTINASGATTTYKDGSSKVEIGSSILGRIDLLEQTILHELVHAGSVYKIHKWQEGQLEGREKEAVEKLHAFYKIFTQRMIDKYGKQGWHDILSDLTSGRPNPKELLDLEYAGANLKEFIAVGMTSPLFQEFMKEEVWKGKQSFLDRLFEILGGLLKTMGIKPNESLTREFINEALAVIDPNLAAPVVKKETPPKSTTKPGKAVNLKESSLFSGGAKGADTHWGQVAGAAGARVHHFYIEGSKTPVGNTPVKLTTGSRRAAEDALREANKTLKRNYPTRNDYVNNLLIRNYFQVYNSEVVYAVGNFPVMSTDTVVEGGTGWAVQMAKDMNKKTYFFNQRDAKWYVRDVGEESFSRYDEGVPVIESKAFAAIGSRDITASGKGAIEKVINKTIKESKEAEEAAPAGTLAMQPDNVAKIKSGDKTTTIRKNPTDIGVRTLPDGTKIKLSYKGVVKYEGADTVNLYKRTPFNELLFQESIDVDTFAQKEGFKDWNDFVQNNKFSTNFIENRHPRQYYGIELVNPVANEETITTRTGTGTGKIVYTEEQSKVIAQAREFLEKGEPKEYFTIIGKAGTGKTTIAAEVMKDAKGPVFVGALSHKAKEVIQGKFQEAGIGAEFGTIAGLLGYTLDEVSGKFIRKKYQPSPPPITYCRTIMIDEASLVNEEALELMLQLKLPDAKIIFLGDSGQLPPIRTKDSDFYKKAGVLEKYKDNDSPVFESPNSGKLTERIRQGEESPILPFADFYWDNAHSTATPVQDPVKPGFRKDVITDKGALIFSNKYLLIENQIVESFKQGIADKNPYHIKIVTYRNITRNTINKRIHDAIFGMQAPELNDEELIMFLAPWSPGASPDEDAVIQNSKEAQLENVTKPFIMEGKYEGVLADISLGSYTMNIPLLTKKGQLEWKKDIKALFDKAETFPYGDPRRNKTFSQAYALRDKYPSYDYAYAITSHKSQGSTYDISVVHEQDIMVTSGPSDKAKSQSTYVGITRAANVVVVISSKPVPENNQLTTEQLNNKVTAGKSSDALPLSTDSYPNGKTFSFRTYKEAMEMLSYFQRHYGEERIKPPVKDKNFLGRPGGWNIEILPTAVDAFPAVSLAEEESRDARFEKITKRLNSRIKRLERTIAREQTEFKKATDRIEAGKIAARISRLEATLSRLMDEREASTEVELVEEVLEVLDTRLASLTAELNSPGLTPDELYGIKRDLEWIIALGTFRNDRNHILFTPDEVRTESLRRAFGERKLNAEGLLTSADFMIRDYITEWSKTMLGRNLTEEELFDAIKDVNKYRAYNLDTTRIGDTLSSAISVQIKNANFQAQYEAAQIVKSIDELLEKVEPKLKKRNPSDPYDIFLQRSPSGKRTGNLVYPYSQAYFNERSARFRKYIKDRSTRSWKEFKKWTAQNEIIFDPRLLLPTVDGEFYQFEFTPVKNEVEAHRAALKEHMGDHLYNKTLKLFEERVERFKIQYEAFVSEVMSNPLIPEEEKALAIEKYDKENSPYWAMEAIKSSKNITLSNGEAVSLRGFSNTYTVPRKYTVDSKGYQKDTEWYDNNYKEIESDPDLLQFYEYILNTLYVLKSVLPEHKKQNMQINTLPFLKKGMIELFTEDGIKAGLTKGLLDKFLESVRTNDISDIDYSERDPDTGEIAKITRLNLADESAMKQKIYNIRERQFEVQVTNAEPSNIEEVLKKFNMESHPAYNSYKAGRLSYEQLITVLQRKGSTVYNNLMELATEEVNKEKSFDISKVIKAYAMQVLAYKHKSNVESITNLGIEAAAARQEVVTNGKGAPVMEPDGTPATKSDGLAMLKEMWDHQQNVFFGLPRQEVEFKTKTVVRTSTEKKRAKEIDEILEDPTLTDKQREHWIAERNSIGGALTGSDTGNTALWVVQLLGMGWNLMSAFSNMSFGWIGNMIEADDGRIFNRNEYFKAMAMVKDSLGKNLTFNRWEPGQSKKIRAIMDRFDFTKDASTELYKASNKSLISKRLRWLNPWQLQKRSEYVNQAPVMIAIMLRHKISDLVEGHTGDEALWEAFDENGEWKTAEYGPEPTDNFLVIKNKVDQTIKKIHGNYDYDLPQMGKKHFWFRALVQFKTWLLEGVAARFETEVRDDLLDITRKGRYTSLKDVFYKNQTKLDAEGGIGASILFTLMQLGRKLIGKNTNFDERFNEVDAANMRANLQELVILMGIIGIGVLIKGMAGDDDDKMIANILLNQLTRLQVDVTLYSNPWEIEKLIKNAVPMTVLIRNAGDWLDAAARFIQADDVISTGANAGNSRLLRETMQALPVTSQAYRLYSTSTQRFDY